MTDSERKEIAERFRESFEVWEAVEHWARRRLTTNTGKAAVDQELIERFEYILNWYETTRSESEPESVEEIGA